MAEAFPSCSIDPGGIDCVRSLALATLKVLQGGETVPDREERLIDFIAACEAETLRMLLDVSMPAMALAGHDDLSAAILRTLRDGEPER